MIYDLRPYQRDIHAAVLESVLNRRGLTFTVEIARQGGKNELSARLELALLILFGARPQDLVKCSPTFKPQLVISRTRLKDRLDDAGFTGRWESEQGYIVRLGNARVIFLSAENSARVVGHTAHLLLEIDEAQDVDKEKYSKEFKPMGATTNVTTVLYGTTWDDSTLLEEMKQTNLELERKDGVRRHFRYDWQEVAKYNPDYAAYVVGERSRLGDSHPLFLSQYCLLPIRGGGGFLSAQQRAQLQGDYPRLHHPVPGRIYVAGIDLAGEAEELERAQLRDLKPRQDATVVTIAELDLSRPTLSDLSYSSYLSDPSTRSTLSTPSIDTVRKRPGIRIVEHYSWTGRRHTDLYPRLVDLLKNVWRCREVTVDATGVGQPVASSLRDALGSVVTPFVFTQPSKSQLGFNLLAAVNSGRLKMYSADGSAEYREFWQEMEYAKSHYRPSQTMTFYVDPSQGHDDFLMSLALVVEAASEYEPRVAKGR